MSELRKGDHVRITFEAVYGKVELRRMGEPLLAGAHQVWLDDCFYLVPSNATIEVIEDLRPGDVYRDPHGYCWVYVDESMDCGNAPWMSISGGSQPPFSCWPDSSVARPLTLLVRDGQPVAS